MSLPRFTAEASLYKMNGQMPSATPQEFASAIVETTDAGAKILNVSAALVQPSARAKVNCSLLWTTRHSALSSLSPQLVTREWLAALLSRATHG